MDIFVFTFRIFRWVIKSGSFIKCQRMCTTAHFIEGFKYFRLLHSVANSDDVYQKILNIVFYLGTFCSSIYYTRNSIPKGAL